MSEWKARRFWREAAVRPVDGGFEVRLDARPLRSPAKAPMILPTRQLAEVVAGEWQAQADIVDPLSMPFTRLANSALDRVVPQRAAVADAVARYGESDLVCYRAESPQELVDRQAAGWDPLIDWAAGAFDARLRPVAGVMFVPQPPDAVANLRDRVHALGAWPLTALHELVALSGSLVIGLAATHTDRSRAGLWAASRIDETYQAELWGTDPEAAANAEARASAFSRAAAFHDLSVGA